MRNCFLLLSLLCAIVIPGYASANNSVIQLQWPVNFSDPWTKVNSPFGPRLKASENNRYDFHRGIDILGTTVDPILAMADGIVFRTYEDGDDSSPYPDSGNVVILKHTLTEPYHFHHQEIFTYYTLYLHLDRFTNNLTEDATIHVGDTIGYIGSSGITYTEHLHFEVRLGTTCSLEADCNTTGFDPHVNPMTFLEYPEMNRAYVRLRKAGTQLRVRVKVPGDELDMNTIKIVGLNHHNEVVKRKVINFNTRRGVDASSTTTIDTPTYHRVTITPKSFSRDAEYKTIEFTVNRFFNTDIEKIKILITDVHGNRIAYRLRKKLRLQIS